MSSAELAVYFTTGISTYSHDSSGRDLNTLQHLINFYVETRSSKFQEDFMWHLNGKNRPNELYEVYEEEGEEELGDVPPQPGSPAGLRAILNTILARVSKPTVIPITEPGSHTVEQVVQNQYVPVERSTYRDATQYALKEYLLRYPGGEGDVNYIESLITQYLEGVQISEAKKTGVQTDGHKHED